MLRTERLQRRIREAGFTFDRQADRVMIWRKGILRVNLPRRDSVPEVRARAILEQAGLSPADIEDFLACARQ